MRRTGKRRKVPDSIGVIQKFGGTSVADADKIHRAARRAIRAVLDGHQALMVVSAMGKTTDKLVQLARDVARKPAKREMDMLLSTGEQVSIALMAMAIHDAGYDAVSLTGGQVGMLTDSDHTRARIQSIDAPRIRGHLDAGKIVIAAGFQGVDRDFNITTLGRGGSDTTAVALAAALEAQVCEIYTDVDGIYTADPRVIPTARKLDEISYDEMLEMASRGAGVMHGRSIELGMKYGVPIHVRSSMTDNPGTIIMNATPAMEGVAVRSATLKPNITRVTFGGLPNQPGITAQIFDTVAEHGVFVDDIMQNVAEGGAKVTVGFTVAEQDTAEVRAVCELLAQRLGTTELDVTTDLARVSIVGVGMRSHSGVAARMFKTLADAQINIQNVTTSEIVVSVLVQATDGERACQLVHEAFGLG
jgi:aspartate kinase